MTAREGPGREALGLDGPGATLLLTTDDPARPGGGREMLSRLLQRLLGELCSDLTVLRCTSGTGALAGMAGRLNGLDLAALDRAIAAQGTAHLFIDGSNLGAAARHVKQRWPKVRVATFFQNCETRFFADALRAAPGPRALAVLAGHHRAEAMALRWSDCRITLSQRDSDELRARFGRSGDAVLPMALADTWHPGVQPVERDGPYALFVGGGFFGNLAGVEWYAREVAPALALQTLVVGRGLESLAGRLPAGIELVGAVDDLAPWYAGAGVVVAPILSGSGMKTKVAEALMHGKAVVGTAEAFSGYADAVVAANQRCDGAAAFANAVNAAGQSARFEPPQRALYEQFHSVAAMRQGLAAILNQQL